VRRAWRCWGSSRLRQLFDLYIGIPSLEHSAQCALSDILATSPDNLAKNRVKMAIEYRRKDFYTFEFYGIWHFNIYIN
jgi:hypothetical protein